MGTGDCEPYRNEISKYDWNIETAMAVCDIESNGSITATNWKDSHKTCDGSFGLFQVGCLHGVDKEDLYNPEINIRVAYQIYLKQGWSAWSTTMKKLALL